MQYSLSNFFAYEKSLPNKNTAFYSCTFYSTTFEAWNGTKQKSDIIFQPSQLSVSTEDFNYAASNICG